MRSKIIFLGQLTSNELNEISDFLATPCQSLGKWAKFTRTDSPFCFAVCSNGEHFIRLSGYDTNGLRFYKIKEVKTFINNCGYVGVSGFSTMHQLVGEAFIPNFVPYPEKEINHIDGNKLNNDISNLELVSHQENLVHFWTEDCMTDCRATWLNNHIGRHWSDSQRKKFMQSFKPKPMSDETKSKISATHKGKTLSAQHIARIKEVNKGNTNNLGKIIINNGVHNKMIYSDSLSEWEQKGYQRGMVPYKRPHHRGSYTHTKQYLEKHLHKEKV